ncbi:dTDP-glucose 4,6-dehydratase [Desulfomonile tiedjei]|uniref:dTDP-glucose 4,6-dehydratase n=1 Tax=Desulfomonile tiedjei (strain ATCC 49306 / DSM 6799 / DCB-1) TaxID=706587 RepID=I4C0W7_DESTA|nr:dTDP-glucose 4,6-dehydratase [Desulfomonile tiedjei]AFM23208.1 dTDP-glucose 4,6-dehydratase [Desulfomonile tiedjei DSM 6799]
MKLLVTGGCGFIGSNFVFHMLESYPDVSIVNLDLLTYAGNLENLQDVTSYGERHRFVRGDISDPDMVCSLISEKPDVVVNFAAESHVDRSIMDCCAFIHTNIRGTQVLLDACRQYKIPRFVQISTDEVYGSLALDDPPFCETNQICPNSPYAASKASADLLVRSYHKTYGMDCVITRCSNNYGPYQFPEKLIPLMITNALHDFQLPVYGDGLNVRDWIHVQDHCRAIDLAIRKGRTGEVYNIGADSEFPNIEIVKHILDRLSKSHSLITFVKDRPGHDRRYAMNAAKMRNELGWQPLVDFREGLNQTISWYIEHEMWWQRIKSGQYLNYYEEWYGSSLGGAATKTSS